MFDLRVKSAHQEKNILLDLVSVESWFGSSRSSNPFKFKWSWSEDKYDDFLQLGLALLNAYIKRIPLEITTMIYNVRMAHGINLS